MSNLLKDASILLTPTGYDNGRMNAIKPSKDLEGPELVTNGDFATDSDWTKGTGWSIANGKASRTAQSGSTSIYQSVSFTANKSYKITYDLDINAGSFLLRIGGGTLIDTTIRTTSGTYTEYIVANSGNNVLNLRAVNGAFTGSVDNVSVVEDLSGDFNFERNSAATRVNAQGLVENVQIISPELVSNGNFSQIGTEEVLNGNFSQEGSELITNGSFDTDSDWSKGTGWSIANGEAILTNGSGSLSKSDGILEVGKTYLFSIEITSISLGAFSPKTNTGQNIFDSVTLNTVGVHTSTFTVTSGVNLQIRASGTTTGSIDNVSIKEVGQNWILGTGWSIGEDEVVGDGTSFTFLTQNLNLINKNLKLTFEIKDYQSGTFRLPPTDRGDGLDVRFSGNGTQTVYYQSTLNTFRFQQQAFNGSITNISVKEVGQDWSVIDSDADNYVEFNQSQGTARLKFLNTSPLTKLQSTAQYVSGKKYKLIVDVAEVVSGGIKIDAGGVQQTYNTVGIQESIIEPTGNQFIAFYRATADVDITLNSVSVKEITDDTNIPRINYEGFSYQDSLGSEEVVNGDFSNGLTNWTNNSSWWSIVNGEAYHPASTSMKPLSQSVSTEVGKEYKISVNVNIVSGTPQVFWDKVSGQEAQSLSQGLNEVIVTTFRTNSAIYFGRVPSINTEFYIDNVSVKEYLGQEIVPDSGCGSWLLEKQSTNLITYSSDFSQWIISNATIDSNVEVSPDGTINSDRINFTTSGGFVRFITASGDPNGDTYTDSVYLKSDTSTSVRIAILGSGGGLNYTVVPVTLNSEWQRFSVSASFTGAGDNVRFRILADEIGSIFAWGAQVEQQSYATSYVPTSGAANTRLQDIATNSGNSSLINSTEGVLYAEIAALEATSSGSTYITITDGTYNNRASILFSTGATNQIRTFLRVGGATQIDVSDNVSDVTDFNKIAFSYKENDFKVYINGALVSSDTNGSVWSTNTINKLTFSEIGTAAGRFKGKTKALAVYKEALTDANLRCLTYPNPVATTFDLDFDTIAEQFTFTRGSEATFVNEQGLIQSTNQIGPELVTNGDFATDSNWSKGTGWSIANGKATSDASANGYLNQQVYEIGKKYKLNFEVLEGTIELRSAQYSQGTGFYTAGAYSIEVIPSTTATHFYVYTGFGQSSIDNVSVKEVTTATNTPRIDYSTGAEAFLLEPQSTNLTPYSEDFSQSAWVKTGLNITSNSIASPSGEVNADKWVEDTSNGAHNIRNNPNISVTNGTEYTMSIFAKAGERTGLRFANAAESSVEGRFDLSNGTVTFTGTNTTFVGIEDYGNGWYRCIISFVASTTIAQLNLRLMDGSALSYQGDGTSGLYAWGAQLENLSYATSYIPTNGASATRNQELCNNATPVINSEEGTLYLDVSALTNGGVDRNISLNDNTASNHIRLILHATDNRIVFRVNSGGVAQVNISDYTFEQTDNLKIACVYKQNNFSLWINGVERATDFSGNIPIGLSKLDFSLFNGTQPFFGNTKGLKYYPKALADVQLEDLTTI